MSRKRRKVSKKEKVKVEKKTENEIFRENVMKHITLEMFQKSLGINQTKCRDLIAEKGKVKFFSQHYRFHGFSQHEFFLKSLLQKLGQKTLNSIYEENFPETLQKKKLPKVTLIDEIAARYFEKSGYLEKRDIEAENLNIMMEEDSRTQEYQFFRLCDYELPIDLLLNILSFIKYDKNMLVDIGRICKIFYITILRSWKKVTVTKKKVYQISLLVLRSVRCVTFSVPRYQPSQTFLNSELEHICSHLNPERLVEIKLKMMIFSYVKTLRFICKRKDKSVFRNVRILSGVCDFKYPSRKKDLEAYRPPWKGVQLKNAFPRLEECRTPLNFQILEGISLKSLHIDLDVLGQFSNNGGESIMGKLGSPEREKYLDKTNIKNLSIRLNPLTACDNIPSFLEKGFEYNLESLVLFFGHYHHARNPRKLNLECIRTLKNLKSLTIKRGVASFLDYPLHLSPDEFLPNLREVHIGNPMYSVGARVTIEHLIFFLKFRHLEKLVMSVINLYVENEKWAGHKPHFLQNSVVPTNHTRDYALLMENISKRAFSLKMFIVRFSWKFYIAPYHQVQVLLDLHQRKPNLDFKVSFSHTLSTHLNLDGPPLKTYPLIIEMFPFLSLFINEFPVIMEKKRGWKFTVKDECIRLFVSKSSQRKEDGTISHSFTKNVSGDHFEELKSPIVVSENGQAVNKYMYTFKE